MSTQPQTHTVEIERVQTTALRETEGPRIKQIDPSHVEDLAQSIEYEGLLQAITVITSKKDEYAYDIVDGRHRKRALEQLGVEEVDIYDMPGDRSWAVPSEEAEAELGIQSMAANALQKSLTQAERGRFLKLEIQEKVIEKMDSEDMAKLNTGGGDSPANVRGQYTVPPARQILYHLEEIGVQKADWKFTDELYEELERVRFALDLGEPRTEAEYLQFYSESPKEIVEAWEREDIGKSAVEHLRKIEQDDLRNFALKKASMDSSDDGYSVRDLDAVRRAAKRDIASVNQKIINEEFKDLEDAVELAKQKDGQEPEGSEQEPSGEESEESEEEPSGEDSEESEPRNDEPDSPNKDELEQFKQEELSQEDRCRIEQIADYHDRPQDRLLEICYQLQKEEGEFRQELEQAVKEIEDSTGELRRRQQERKEALNEFDFAEDSRFATGDADHLAPPVETEDLGVFFHDCLQMDDEIDDGSVQLVFTSPPYFTQREKLTDEWWPNDEGRTSENAEVAYENYLDTMEEVVNKCHSKLQEGGHLLLNLSDYQVQGLPTVYDIPSDISYLIRNKLDTDFNYISTITWDKGDGETSNRLGNFRRSNDIADFKPAWQTERILVFRKGLKREDQDYKINREKMKNTYDFNPFADLWKAEPTTTTYAEHESGFPRRLPYLAVKLFTYPGDTIIDPFGGYCTTLRAIKELNEEHDDAPPRKGFAWENFASETSEQPDYRRQVKMKLGTHLASEYVRTQA